MLRASPPHTSVLGFQSLPYITGDSTRFADWVRGLHELFINVRMKSGSMLFPVYAKLTGSEVEFVKGIPEGVGFMFGDGAFDAKPVLNTITSKAIFQ